ncbi:unnamed protein product [Closterium sp. NIES-65]|nr:unnamed protein product [Closterium sp. NIES-65]
MAAEGSSMAAVEAAAEGAAAGGAAGEAAGGAAGGAAEAGVIFVLEKASLEVAKVGKTYVLLNCDDHASFLRKHGKDPALYRPDICHQALLAILDSPLNKAGKLKALYVATTRNTLVQVNPHIRIPRTFRRFCGLMVQLLQKLSIRATNGPDKLLKVIKHPVTKYLPAGCRRIGLEYSAQKVVHLRQFLKTTNSETLVFVVGAMASGDISSDYVDEMIAVSEYPLSAATCLSRLCTTLELKWGIL